MQRSCDVEEHMAHKLSVVVAALTSGIALAQSTPPVNPGSGTTIRPRVLVVFDTSSSMSQAPDFTMTNLSYWDDTDSTSPDTTADANCRSKFCIAKKTVYSQLRDYVQDNVAIGVATYYQYLVRYDPAPSSRCWYDAMWKPGQTLYYPRNSQYEVLETQRFSPLTGVDLSMNNSVVGWYYSNHTLCSTESSQYDLTEQQSPTGTDQTCVVYDRRASPGATYTLGATGLPTWWGCQPSRTYAAAFNQNDNRGGSYYQYRIAPTATCPAAVPVSADYSAVPAGQTLVVGAANTGTCSGNNYNCWRSGYGPFGSPVSDTCTSGTPCIMYSASSGAESPTLTRIEWVGYFGGTCTGGNQPTGSNPGDSSTTLGACPVVGGLYNSPSPGVPGFYDATRVTGGTIGSVSGTFYNDTTNCRGLTVGTEVRLSGGQSLLNYLPTSVTNATIQSAHGGVTSGYTWRRYPPSNTSTCSTNWPCDVTLTSKTPSTNVSSDTTVNDCTASVSGGTTVTCSAAASVTRQLLRTGASCPTFLPALTSNPSGTWSSTYGNPGCGTGTAACTLTPSATPTTVAAMPGCTSPRTTWTSTAPTACSYGGVVAPAYTQQAGSPTNIAVFYEYSKTSGASCPADTSVATASYQGAALTAVNSANNADVTSCVSASCRLNNLAASDSTTLFDTTTTSTNSPPTGYVADSPASTVGTTPVYTSLPCTSYVDGTIMAIPGDSAMGRFSAGSGFGGSTDIGVDPEHPENHIFRCAFYPVTYHWRRPYQRCEYSITKYVWESSPSITWCNYDLARERRVVTDTVNTCTYSTRVRKFDFQPPLYKTCNYFRTATTLTRTEYTYRYLYASKGGELIGSYFRDVASEDACDTSKPYSSFSATCPPTVDECLGTGTTCYLRSSGTTGSERVAYHEHPVNAYAASGRFSNLIFWAGPVEMWAPASSVVNDRFAGLPTATANHVGVRETWGPGYACVASDFSTPPTDEPARSSYCVVKPDAAGTTPRYRLVSDYMDCTDPADPASCAPNNIDDLNNDPRPAAFSLKPGVNPSGTFHPLTATSWTAAATKAYGMSGTGTNYNTPSQMLMSFAPDSAGDGNVDQFRQLLTTCQMPVDSSVAGGNVSWPTWAYQGVCMAEIGSPSTSGIYDYTPLYGALQNAYQYIKYELGQDNNHACRKYFVLLATDGKENTPANRTAADLASAVSQLRSLNAGSRSTDVKTFVLGFGDQVLDSTAAADLNSMANAGGTSGAFFATDQASLAIQLNQVFASILAGTYTRSKPVISSDGRNIYMSYYDVGPTDGGTAVSPEWPGHFAAFSINPSDGNVTARWELSDKLDNKMNDGDRTLYTDKAGLREAFSVGNATSLSPLLNTDSNYPGGAGTTATLDPLDVIRFVRNSAKVTGTAGTGENFFNSVMKRLSRLNAIVTSTPVIVGRSLNGSDWGGAATSTAATEYTNFQTAVAGREPRVMVGSSDGIFRAIRDGVSEASYPTCVTDEAGAGCPNGKEAWGWVPSLLHSKLYESMQGYYSGIDGQTAVEDVCTAANARDCVQADWKTISVTAMRNGARGLIALDVTNPSDPKYLWKFGKTASEDNLGYPQAPVIGRVERASNVDQFVAVVAGGARHRGAFGDLSDHNGDEVHVLNALDGGVVVSFTAQDGVLDMADIKGEDNQFYARPSYFRRGGTPQLDNAMLSGTSGVLYIMRFREPPTTATVMGVPTVISTPVTNTAHWTPRVFFDPADATTTQSPTGAAVTIRRIIRSGTAPSETFTQVACHSTGTDLWSCGASGHPATMPLDASRRLPFYLRPRLTALYDSNRLTADYFIGTGELPDPTVITTASSQEYLRNYFYVVHDVGATANGEGDGRLLWVNQFIDATEQVVSEPAIVNGSLIVATYFPPTAGSGCDSAGDTRLYCFDPLNGNLRSCLVTEAGVTAPFIEKIGAGIPSDLVSANGSLYYTTSNPPKNEQVKPERQPVAAALASGDKRSFRRVR